MLNKKIRKFTSLCLALIICVASIVSAGAVETMPGTSKEEVPVITEDSEYYLTPDEIVNGGVLSEDEIADVTDNGEVILGGFDMPVSAIEQNNARAIEVITGQVWCRSYATYDKEDGVSIYVKLYVPLFQSINAMFLPNPKFTSMSGTATLCINNVRESAKTFFETADEERSIEANIDTGVTASSGTKGTVRVMGVATGNNLLAEAGVFERVYEVTIP